MIFRRREWNVSPKKLFKTTLILVAVIFSFSPVHFLMIRSADGSVRVSYSLQGTEEFAVRYIHSVQKTPVIEVFRVDFREGLELRETVYTDFGAGLPFLLEGSAVFESGGGKFRIYGIKKYLSDVVFRVGRFADYNLLFRGREIPFTQFEKPGKPLRFSGEKHPFLFAFFY